MPKSLDDLFRLMKGKGAVRFYAKKLAPNDNSKNQIYLGGGFSALNIIPHGSIVTDTTVMAGSVRERTKAAINFFWIDENGLHRAPEARLILYPKYPEVRMSGFLKGSTNAPSKIMASREEGRLLFLGIGNDGSVFGYAARSESPLAKMLASKIGLTQIGVFLELGFVHGGGSRSELLDSLKRIYEKNWINSQKLSRDGRCMPYAARNGGGYTLEAELGISPNGYAEPDYLGWEIKQYSVGNFKNFRPKTPATLFTPEPTGGIYKEDGLGEFMRQYSYPDNNGKIGRMNFGGIYVCNGSAHAKTGLKLTMSGFDEESKTINDMRGGVALIDRADRVAASWKFADLMAHWNRKHAKAAFVPSLFKSPPPQYRYGPKILLCEGTDFLLFLKAIARGAIYLDPALKQVTSATGQTVFKKRKQFRMKHEGLPSVYHTTESVSLDAL